jgi:hypothetical protein
MRALDEERASACLPTRHDVEPAAAAAAVDVIVVIVSG